MTATRSSRKLPSRCQRRQSNASVRLRPSAVAEVGIQKHAVSARPFLGTYTERAYHYSGQPSWESGTIRTFTHAIGFDDAPFDRGHRGNVPVFGAIFARGRLDGVVKGAVRRDGADATRVLAGLIRDSRFLGHLQIVFLQGIALAGFNVVDIQGLHDTLGLPVLVVARRRPELTRIRRALLEHVPGGARKWRLIERAGPMEAIAGVHVQRAGLSLGEAERAIARFAVNSAVPEPLRAAHLIAAGVSGSRSRQRV